MKGRAVNRHIKHSLSIRVLALGLSACVVAPAPYGYASADVVVTAPYGPPPHRAEVFPVSPGVGVFWARGFWGWDGRQHRWQDGHWERQRQRQRQRRMPQRWEQDGRGPWRLHPGQWRAP
jgi:hypothetical protein